MAGAPHDEYLVNERNVIEPFNRIKPFRRMATRHEKTAPFAAMLALVGAVIWSI
jgi:transposase